MRWLAVVLALFGLAALQLLGAALSAGAARGRVARSAEPGAGAAVIETAALSPSVARAETGRAQREPTPGPSIDLRAEVLLATDALAQTLASPELDEVAWRADLKSHADRLGPQALPELEAVLADVSRSAEEHVAATELAAALRTR